MAALATLFTLQLRRLLLSSAPGLGEQLGFWQQRVLTVIVILLLAAVNIRGVKWSGGLQLVITLVKVGSLLFIIALPFLALLWVAGGATRAANPARLEPTWPDREQLTFSLLGGFASALLAAQWAYHGSQNLGPVAEEVKEPHRHSSRSPLD